MKILTLSNCPLVESQGSGYVITSYAKGMRQLGHEVELVGPERLVPLWHRVRVAMRYRLALGMAWHALKRLLVRRYDVVEFYGAECWLAVTLIRWLFWWPRFILVLHSNGIEQFGTEMHLKYFGHRDSVGGKPRWWQLRQDTLFRLAYKQVDGILLVSKGEEDYALERGLTGRRGAHGIETPLPDLYTAHAPPVDKPKVIGFVGSWLPRKGREAIIADMPRVLREHTDWSLLLVGVGRAFRKEDHFPADVLDRIEVVGFVEEKPALRALYDRMAILLVPSIYESFGLVVAEGMACGCAVVSGPTGYAAGLTRDEALVLPDPRSPHLGEAVAELVRDEARRRAMGAAAAERAKRATWPMAWARAEALMKEWLAARRRP